MKPRPVVHTLRVLAHLLRYPDAALQAQLGALREALHAEAALKRESLSAIDELIAQLQRAPGLAAETAYVELFDRGRRAALHLFEHVHGDSRDRGGAMVALTQTYEQAGLQLAPGELPDHLSVLLEYASTQPPAVARAFLGEIAVVVQRIHTALVERRSRYSTVLAAVLELAGETPQVVELPPEPAIDDAWAEPAAFDGCGNAGQRSRTPQPIHIQRRPPSSQPAAAIPGANA